MLLQFFELEEFAKINEVELVFVREDELGLDSSDVFEEVADVAVVFARS